MVGPLRPTVAHTVTELREGRAPYPVAVHRTRPKYEPKATGLMKGEKLLVHLSVGKGEGETV